MAKNKIDKENKVWYKKWWVIVLFIVVVLIFLNYYLGKSKFQRNLEEDYKVLSFSCLDEFEDTIGHVEMKSLGDRNDQVWSGLIDIAYECPGMDRYYIKIIEETKECGYSINGDIYRAYHGEQINNTKIMNSIEYLVWKKYVKEEINKKDSGTSDLFDIPYLDIQYYENADKTGITKEFAFTIINSFINEIDECS